MGKYIVKGPVTVVDGKKVKRYTKAHTEAVEITDSVAKKLGDKVEKVGTGDDDGQADSKGGGPSADTADTQAANASKGAKGR
jgi:hypothetical protein